MAKTLRQRLDEYKAAADAARGRPLTPAERLENLRRAVARICVNCGAHVEPNAVCADCKTLNPEEKV